MDDEGREALREDVKNELNLLRKEHTLNLEQEGPLKEAMRRSEETKK